MLIRSFLILYSLIFILHSGYSFFNNDELEAKLEALKAENKKQQTELIEQKNEIAVLTEKAIQLESALEKQKTISKMLKSDSDAKEQHYKETLGKNRKKISDLKQSYQSLKKKDTTEFANIEDLMKNKKWSKAAKAYDSFITAYPNSNLVSDARKNSSLARSELRNIQRTKNIEARNNAVNKSRKVFINKIKNGEVELSQLRPLLLGQSADAVKRNIGEPDEIYSGNKWKYKDKVFSTETKTKMSLKVILENNRVTKVDYWDYKAK